MSLQIHNVSNNLSSLLMKRSKRDAMMSCQIYLSMSQDLPILCSNCLGGDGNLRIVKQTDGEECKVCTRPFTVFRWQLNDGSKRAHKTLICHTCASVRNCCQSCMLDINFLIPLDIRDTALKMAGLGHLVTASSESRNSEVKAIAADKQQRKLDEQPNSMQDNEKAREVLQKIASGINAKDIKSSISVSSKQIGSKKTSESTSIPANLSKIIKALPFSGSIETPSNDLTSFFFFGVPEDLPQYIISEFFEQYGKLKSISVVHKSKCGFVSYNSRKSAEKLAESIKQNTLNSSNSKTPGLVILNGSVPLRVAWSSIKPLGNSGSDHQKLALVVNKVMVQLAEKDHKAPSKKHPRITSSNSSSKAPSTKPMAAKAAAKYKSSAADFEL